MNKKIVAVIFTLLVLALVVAGCNKSVNGEETSKSSGDSLDSFGNELDQINDSDLATDDLGSFDDDTTIDDL